VTPITSKQNFDNYSNNKIDENIKFTEENNCEFKYIKSEAFEKKYEIADKKSVSVKDETNIKIIGEAFKNYIIAEINDEIIIVDKHAAHERVLFEKLKSGKQKLSCQIMLRPVDILLSDEEYSAVSEHKEIT
jgi:DNA mismatch repair protein MutL